MIVYAAMALAWAAGAFVSSLTSHRGRPWGFILFASSVLVLVVALRNVTVGTDTAGYRRLYYTRYLRDEEPGFSTITRLAYDSGLHFQWFLAIAAVASVAGLVVVIANYSKYPFMSLYLHLTIGYFALSMSGIRQAIAVSITLVAFTFLMRGNRLFFVALVFLAASFHNSAIVFLPVLLVRRIKLNRRRAAALIAASGMLVLAPPELIGIAVDALPLDRYDNYLMESNATLNPFTVVVAGLIPVACLFLWPGEDREAGSDAEVVGSPHISSVLIMMAIINFCLMVLSLEVPIISRLTYYFITYVTILLPNIIGTVRDENARRVAWLVCLSLPAIQFLLSVPGGSLGIDDYESVGW